MADIALQPPPYMVPIADSSGGLRPAWVAFFRTLYARVGQSVALSNLELEALHDDNLTALQNQVTALFNTVTSLQAQITSGLNDLDQGRQL
jgi:hypothetical protein